jgi:DNA-binding NarL/FixJ family response regulator
MGNMFERTTNSIAWQPTHTTPARLTPRQLDVLALLCEGLPNKLIARRLNIAGATVKIHVAHILRELNVSSRLQAVIAAQRCGLIGEPAPVQAVERAPLALQRPIVLRADTGRRVLAHAGL